MRDKTKADNRTKKQILEETINSIIELQDVVGILFPWKAGLKDNEITINNNTIQLLTKYIKLQKGETD